jgi:hypothetical protein
MLCVVSSWLLLLLFPQENVNRLKAYKSNLVVFPRARNAKKPKVGRAGQQEPWEKRGPQLGRDL